MLSRLLEEAARGEEVIITCDGKAKARLVGMPRATPFRVYRELLVRPRRRGTPAEDIVRQDRDGRG